MGPTYNTDNKHSCRLDNTPVIGCVKALGETLPPYIIFKGKNKTPGMSEHAIPGSVFINSESGWITTELFVDFFENRFFLKSQRKAYCFVV